MSFRTSSAFNEQKIEVQIIGTLPRIAITKSPEIQFVKEAVLQENRVLFG
jgi:hypothetical protein